MPPSVATRPAQAVDLRHALKATVVILFAAAATYAYQADRAQSADRLARGTALFRAGKFDQAQALFEQVTRLDPGNIEGWKGLGRIHIAQGRYELAEDPLRKACEIDSKDEDACYYLGRTYYGLTRLEDAIVAYKKALTQGRRVWRSYNGMALALDGLGRANEAEQYFQRAIKTYDGTAVTGFSPHIDFGAFLYRQGRFEDALRTLRTAVAEQPRSAKAQFELARTLVQMELLEPATAHLGKAIEIEPGHGPAHLLLGKVNFRLGRAAEGERHTEIGRKLVASGSSTP